MDTNFDLGKTMVNSFIKRASYFTVGDILAKNARIKAGQVAVASEGRELTYAQLNEEVNKLGNSLDDLGIRRGDRMAILSENRIEYCEAIYAAAKLGVIVPALNWRFSSHELKESILLTTPETILVSQEYFPALESILESLPFIKRLILLDKIKNKVEFQTISVYHYEDLISSGSPEEIHKEVTIEDGLLILYTSGTTGVSKGAIISHRALITISMVFLLTFNLISDDSFIAWSPMFHMASTDYLIATHSMGGKVIIMRRYDPAKIASVLERERISWLFVMPGAVDTLIAELKARPRNIKGVKAVGAMADLIPPAQISELTTLLGAPFYNSFGSTEGGPAPASGSFIPVGFLPVSLSKTESLFCEVRLVDEKDVDVAVGESGEIIIRGPTLFSGYWGNSEANEKDFRGGWFHTGDVFRRNPNGTLDFLDRKKYLIKSGGENIYPAEIERVLMSYPGVQEAVVVRVKDQKWGEVPKAYVACKEKVDAAILLEFCYQRLARYKAPKSIKFVSADQFPRSTTGKVLRSELEKWD